jgi:hypothetical protein
MEPDRWRQIERLYESALQRPERDRASFLADACVGDEELRREVASLLAQESAAADFIEVPAIRIATPFAAQDQEPATQTSDTATDIVGHAFGPYRVLERLGGGGMGIVYRPKTYAWVAPWRSSSCRSGWLKIAVHWSAFDVKRVPRLL